MLYETYEEARVALETAVSDVSADMGEEAVDACWSDLVRHIADDCSTEVRSELLRREGMEER